MLRNAIEALGKFLFFIAGLAMVSSVGLAFAAVVMRYVFNFSLEWIEEGARYLALLAAFLVAGPVLRERGHVALDLLTSGLTGKRHQIHRLVSNIVALLVGAAIFAWGMELVLQTYEFGLMTGSLQFPQWLPFSIVPLGMALLVVFAASEIVEAWGVLRAPAAPPDTNPNGPSGDALGQP